MTTFDKVKEIIVKQLGVEPADVSMDANIFNDLGADYLDGIEILMTLEEEFDIEIPDAEYEKMKTVKDAVEMVDRNK